MTAPRLTPPLKWHGGKAYLAADIVRMMPPHLSYVEVFAGGCAVLLAKPPAGAEVVNDLNADLSTFWRVLQRPDAFERFMRQVDAVPFSEREWADAGTMLTDERADEVTRAVAFFVRCRQSLAGRMNAFAPLSRSRTRRGMCEQVSAWLGAVDGLPAVHERLRRVAVLNRPALEVITAMDAPGTLLYCDPPYLPSTRTAPDVYRCEMTEDDHAALLDSLNRCQAKVILSGYRNALYDAALADWHRNDFDMANHAAGGTTKRRMVESVWCNFEPQGGPA